MSAFNDAEIAYLEGQRLGRIATVGPDSQPHVVPVAFRYNADEDTIDIGGTLARKWAAVGHTVILGVRDPAAARIPELVAGVGPGTTAQSIPDAAGAAEAVVFAIPGAAMPDMVASLAADLDDKVVIDAT